MNIDALTKLATELTDRVDQLEHENAELKSSLDTAKAQVKTASEQKPGMSVSEQTVDATLAALLKTGSLNQDQIAESKKILMSDAEAPHRILQKLLEVQSQNKIASDKNNINGGTLAYCDTKRDHEDDCMDRMMSILKF